MVCPYVSSHKAIMLHVISIVFISYLNCSILFNVCSVYLHIYESTAGKYSSFRLFATCKNMSVYIIVVECAAPSRPPTAAQSMVGGVKMVQNMPVMWYSYGGTCSWNVCQNNIRMV
jgi:hypothetical protein